MTDPTDKLPLEERTGLPEALRVLLEDYPREAWEADPNFSGLIRFWLDRHMMFRKLLALMTDETEKTIDREIAPERFGANLSRYGSMFVGELHGHHSVEDAHYFPQLKGLDPRLERGFDLLDRDHHALDGHLERFTSEANAALRAISENAGTTDRTADLRAGLVRMERFLNRHLEDEEDLVVPVLLKFAPAGLA